MTNRGAQEVEGKIKAMTGAGHDAGHRDLPDADFLPAAVLSSIAGGPLYTKPMYTRRWAW